MGASVPETGSHPTGQAELHRLDASRFDPARIVEQMPEQEAVECLQLKLAAARSWLAKCDSEVAAFSATDEGLRPFLEVWEAKQAGTARQVAFYQTLLAIYDDRNEWRVQHENLVEVRRADLVAMEARFQAAGPKDIAQ
jgi:hypothetical protein